MEKGRLIIHVGMQKTGTTFMQKSIFPELQNVYVIKGFDRVIELIRGKNKVFPKVLITDENISGRMRGGSYFADFARNVEAIKLIFQDDPKIIVGFRKHDAFLHSAYKYMLRSGLSKDFDHIFNSANTGVLKFEDLYYKKRIDLLKDNFSDVFVYTNESMRADLSRFLQALMTFIGEENALEPFRILQKKDQNIGIKGQFQVSTLKKINKLNEGIKKVSGTAGLYGKFFKRIQATPGMIFQRYLHFFPSREYELPTDITNFVNEHYATDWSDTLQEVTY